MKDYLGDWLANVDVRPSTRRRYAQIVEGRLIPALGHYKLSNLQPEHVEKMLRDRPALSKRSRIHLRAVLRTALNKAVRQRKVTFNAAALAEGSGGAGPKAGAFLDAEQVQRFLAAVAGDPLEGLYLLAVCLGMRQGELLGLQWDCVDFAQRTIRIRQQLQADEKGKLQLADTKSEKSHRMLPMTAQVEATLHAHKARTAKVRLQAGSPYVFTTRAGTPCGARNVVRAFKHALQQAGLPEIRFHDLRHSCNSILAAKDVDARVRMEILGHSDVRLTRNVYTHVVPAAMREAVEGWVAFLPYTQLP